MNRTSIEWCKNPDGTQGYTWNPITGCLNGCPYCYARKLANGRLKQRYLANDHITRTPYETRRFGKRYLERESDPFYPRFWPEKFNWHRTYSTSNPRGIFVCDMSDLFGLGIPEDWTRQVLDYCRIEFEERFYLLTKQPQNLAKFSPFPDNCWVGVSATDFEGSFNEALMGLEQVNAKLKYISFEPLLNWGDHTDVDLTSSLFKDASISWVIIGSQTKPYRPPKVEWVKEIVEAADRAGVPVFLKDNLRTMLCDALANKQINKETFFVKGDGYGWNLRQEMPA